MLKVSGTYTAPYRIPPGGVPSSQSGAPLTTIDICVGKAFLLPRGGSVSLHLDACHAANASATIQAVATVPSFAAPPMTLSPRTVRAGARAPF